MHTHTDILLHTHVLHHTCYIHVHTKAIYEQLKKKVASLVDEPGIGTVLLSASFASCVSSTFTYPISLTQRTMQMQGASDGQYMQALRVDTNTSVLTYFSLCLCPCPSPCFCMHRSLPLPAPQHISSYTR